VVFFVANELLCGVPGRLHGVLPAPAVLRCSARKVLNIRG